LKGEREIIEEVVEQGHEKVGEWVVDKLEAGVKVGIDEIQAMVAIHKSMADREVRVEVQANVKKIIAKVEGEVAKIKRVLGEFTEVLEIGENKEEEDRANEELVVKVLENDKMRVLLQGCLILRQLCSALKISIFFAKAFAVESDFQRECTLTSRSIELT